MKSVSNKEYNHPISKPHRIRHCCGEVLLIKEEMRNRIILGCGYCEDEFEKLEQFLKHTLKHMAIARDSIDGLVRDTVLMSLPELNIIETETSQQCEESSMNSLQNIAENENIQYGQDNELVESDKSLYDELVEIDFDYTEEIDIVKDEEIIEITPEDEEMVNGDHQINEKIDETENKTNEDSKWTKYDAKVYGLEDTQIKSKGPYTCDICGKVIVVRNTFIKHMRKHKNIRPYVCDICGVAFADQCNLTVHTQRHLGIKKHSCSICNKRFTSTTEVKIHMRSHTGERPYKCETCGETFTVSSQLCLHRRKKHTLERPHSCNECGMRFYEKKEVLVHSATHTGQRPYQCDYCATSYLCKKSLKQHMKTRHAEVQTI